MYKQMHTQTAQNCNCCRNKLGRLSTPTAPTSRTTRKHRCSMNAYCSSAPSPEITRSGCLNFGPKNVAPNRKLSLEIGPSCITLINKCHMMDNDPCSATRGHVVNMSLRGRGTVVATMRICTTRAKSAGVTRILRPHSMRM